MKNMKAAAVAAIAFAALNCAIPGLRAEAATSTPNGFTDNLDQALEAAKASGKYVFACFSGSDWCGWCVDLEKEVLSKTAFLDGVTNDYELVFIDSPNDESLLTERAKVENPKLVDKYRVEGFPTALILSPAGEVLTKTGYREGGPEKYAKYLKYVRENGPRLKEIEQLVELHIEPFEDEIRKIVAEEINAKFRARLKDVPQEEREAKAMAIAGEILPNAAKKVEAALEAFKAKQLPEIISMQRSEAIEGVEGLLKELKEPITKK